MGWLTHPSVIKSGSWKSWIWTWTTSKGDVVLETGLKRNNKIRNCMDFDARCQLFMEECEDLGRSPTIARLCLILGYPTKEDLFKDFAYEIPPSLQGKEHMEVYKRYRKNKIGECLLYIEARKLEHALERNPAGQAGILELKNFFNYKDKIEVENNIAVDFSSLAELVDAKVREKSRKRIAKVETSALPEAENDENIIEINDYEEQY